MKRIQPLEEPTPGLVDHLECDGENANWDRFRSHQSGAAYRELFDRLRFIQHGLCGYCEIDITENDRQVEHVIPRSDPLRGAEGALAHGNLIACCKGGTWKTDDETRRRTPVRRNRGCGEAKENVVDPDFVDPRILPALPSLAQVRLNGKIVAKESACSGPSIDADRVNRTIAMLGLNVERLRFVQEKRWRDLNESWQEHFEDPEVMMEAARKELLPDGDNRLPRFFTTNRSYYHPLAEETLAEVPQAWI